MVEVWIERLPGKVARLITGEVIGVTSVENGFSLYVARLVDVKVGPNEGLELGLESGV